MRLLAGIGVAAVLASCADVPHKPKPVPADVATVVGVPVAETEQFGTPDAGVTAVDSRLADLKPSTVGIARGEVFVVVQNSSGAGHRVQMALPVATIDRVALVKYGNMGHLRQVHVLSGVSKLVFSYGFGDTPTAEAFVRRLVALGAKEGPAPTRYVERPGEAGAVPIFIPMPTR
jgi:hypothetical protein